jgi:hypothetical protein
MTPGLSPVVGQNPAFRLVSFRANGALTDEATYYLFHFGEAAPEWKLEYRFAETWRAQQINFQSFSRLSRDIESKPAVRDRWSLLYSVSRSEGPAITKQTFPPLFCATGNHTDTNFQACVKRIQGGL